MSSKLVSEEQVKSELGISDLSSITSDEVKDFIDLIPSIDKDVLISIINQIPFCAETAKAMVQELTNVCDSFLKSNEVSQIETIKSCQKVLDSLDKVLSNGDLNFEEKKYFTEKMIEVVNLIADKDTENKSFISDISRNITTVAVGVISFLAGVGLAVIIGGNVGSADANLNGYVSE